ncbi:uncharacterized protein GIQ15_05324 [Arthroderma uncinatum]|uniref:uncharacterized protein n=1 Tax=Arthroderma uncinatum TaxID=74035 RepID=UPI00144A9458|nr:uncharacterized protein GIQ15_05324 [Arthroderma uncinatum]KAF3482565.1 hypothetical protein GIQ15_05324 [Arthroderma uncinatum]
MAEDTAASTESRSWFPAIPQPVKRVFDQFPLVTYPPNAAPARSTGTTGTTDKPDEHRLYIFASPQAARKGRPSVNPQCLKWQAYLKFSGIRFRTIPSNNHASPNGALPFLLPASAGNPGTDDALPVPSNRLQRWADEQAHVDQGEAASMREEVYTSLLDHRIRDAWLYTVYLDSSNFGSIARRAYVEPSTNNSIVRTVLACQLQEAARSQLLRTSTYIDVDDILAEAKNAFEALSVLLGSDSYFFGRAKPGLFDASVFAYVHLILDQKLGWNHNPLATYLDGHDNLLQHHERLFNTYF